MPSVEKSTEAHLLGDASCISSCTSHTFTPSRPARKWGAWRWRLDQLQIVRAGRVRLRPPLSTTFPFHCSAKVCDERQPIDSESIGAKRPQCAQKRRQDCRPLVPVPGGAHRRTMMMRSPLRQRNPDLTHASLASPAVSTALRVAGDRASRRLRPFGQQDSELSRRQCLCRRRRRHL